MDKKITLQLDSYTDAAGKYKAAAPRQGNEDSCLLLVSAEGGAGYTAYANGGAPEALAVPGAGGTVMVVADGMGGMNAGEVASAIAIDVAAKAFDTKVSASAAGDAAARGRFLEDVIRRADAAVKADGSHDGEHAGMGSTMIMAWLVGNGLTVTWIGDSRAYLYRPGQGITPLSRDHSYVQELANQGVLTYEETFGHPQGNIVTRSLGDPSQAARPETAQYTVGDGDMVLLCSDGLSGVLRDRHADGGQPGEATLEDVMAADSGDAAACRQALAEAARGADWYDNVTIMLCRVVAGAGTPEAAQAGKTLENGKPLPSAAREAATKKPRSRRSYVIAAVIFAIFFVAGAAVAIYFRPGKDEAKETKEAAVPQKAAKPASPVAADTLEDVQRVQSTQQHGVQQHGAPGTPSAQRTPSRPQQQPSMDDSHAVQDKMRQSAQSDKAKAEAKPSDKLRQDNAAKAEDKAKPAPAPQKPAVPSEKPANTAKDKETQQPNK